MYCRNTVMCLMFCVIIAGCCASPNRAVWDLHRRRQPGRPELVPVRSLFVCIARTQVAAVGPSTSNLFSGVGKIHSNLARTPNKFWKTPRAKQHETGAMLLRTLASTVGLCLVLLQTLSQGESSCAISVCPQVFSFSLSLSLGHFAKSVWI